MWYNHSMGIFSRLKSMFSSDITFDPQKAKSVVSPCPLKGGKIKINSKVKVPEGYAFVLGSAGKCLDAFYYGEFFLSAATLPECCKKLKIHKTDKKNRIKKNFKADAYFVKTTSFDLKLKTNSKAELGSRANGIFKVGMECDVKLKVLDLKKYTQVLLDEYAYLRSGEAEKITIAYINDFVLDILYKFNFSLFELVACNPKVEEKIKEELGRRLAKTGLALEEMTEVRYILPKKYQKEYEENLNKQNPKQEQENVAPQEETQEQTQEENATEQTLDAPQTQEEQTDEQAPQDELKPAEQDAVEQQPKQEDDDYVPFGGIVIEKDDKQTAKEETPKQEVQPKREKTPMEQIEEQFVDLNLDNLYKNDKKGKRCPKCGYLNEENVTVCEVCQTDLD